MLGRCIFALVLHWALPPSPRHPLLFKPPPPLLRWSVNNEGGGMGLPPRVRIRGARALRPPAEKPYSPCDGCLGAGAGEGEGRSESAPSNAPLSARRATDLCPPTLGAA